MIPAFSRNLHFMKQFKESKDNLKGPNIRHLANSLQKLATNAQ